jgi:acetylornithine deacetylase
MVRMPLSDIDLLARFVACDTTSDKSNLPFADLVCGHVDRGGVRIRRLPSEDGRKVNLVITAGPEPGDDLEGLVLCGHMDVVPPGDGWTSDPFSLTRRDDRLFGRGACDMKGFLAVATNVFAEVGTLRRPLALVFTYDEEAGTTGARRLAESGAGGMRLPLATLVGEPTRLEVVRAHKGLIEMRVTVAGRSAHSGYPHLGRSAIEPAARVAVALAGLRERLAAERPPNHDLFPDVPYVPLNIGTIRGGTAPNVVPDRCELVLTFRPLPGDDGIGLRRRVEQAVREGAGDAPVEIEVVSESPPMEAQPDAALLRALVHENGGARPTTVSYATDAGWLQRLGLHCVVFGPGDIAVAHKPDEYVRVQDLTRARQVLERVIKTLCG